MSRLRWPSQPTTPTELDEIRASRDHRVRDIRERVANACASAHRGLTRMCSHDLLFELSSQRTSGFALALQAGLCTVHVPGRARTGELTGPISVRIRRIR